MTVTDADRRAAHATLGIAEAFGAAIGAYTANMQDPELIRTMRDLLHALRDKSEALEAVLNDRIGPDAVVRMREGAAL